MDNTVLALVIEDVTVELGTKRDIVDTETSGLTKIKTLHIT